MARKGTQTEIPKEQLHRKPHPRDRMSVEKTTITAKQQVFFDVRNAEGVAGLLGLLLQQPNRECFAFAGKYQEGGDLKPVGWVVTLTASAEAGAAESVVDGLTVMAKRFGGDLQSAFKSATHDLQLRLDTEWLRTQGAEVEIDRTAEVNGDQSDRV
ncbi:hypothetical protein FJZ36_15195 [Candidatus Poribacteria bacterium]|nr:hypothetical protein [Candidatus Poribacteria bacterium]